MIRFRCTTTARIAFEPVALLRKKLAIQYGIGIDWYC
jgi:hypothetical protein